MRPGISCVVGDIVYHLSNFSFREVWSTDCLYVRKAIEMLLGQNKAHQCVHMGHSEFSTFVSGSSGTSGKLVCANKPLVPRTPEFLLSHKGILILY